MYKTIDKEESVVFRRTKAATPTRIVRHAMVSSEIPVLPMISSPLMISGWSTPESDRELKPPTTGPNGMKPLFTLVFSDGRRIPLGTKCVIGRAAPVSDSEDSTAIVVPDLTQQISRKHCEVGVTSIGQVWVMDCGSLNGTWINSAGNVRQLPQKVRVRLYPGDVIRFGNEWAELHQTWQ